VQLIFGFLGSHERVDGKGGIEAVGAFTGDSAAGSDLDTTVLYFVITGGEYLICICKIGFILGM
jgi:hypothetical protein